MLNISYILLYRYNMIRRAFALHQVFQGIIHGHFIVEIIHFSQMDIIAVHSRIIDFSKQKRIWILVFDGRIHKTPELNRNHLSHIKTEAIHTKIKPIQSDVTKLLPRIRHLLVLPECIMIRPFLRIETSRQLLKIFGSIRTNAVVNLYSFIPIIETRLGHSRSVTGPFGWIFIKLSVR